MCIATGCPPSAFLRPSPSYVLPRRLLHHNSSRSAQSAELAKIASNAFLAQRISSINAISSVCEATGADINEVAKSIGMDPRLGPRFLQTSLGFGGSCFKKDVRDCRRYCCLLARCSPRPQLMALVYLCEFYQLTQVAEYWRQVIGMNEHQKHRFAKKIYDTMNGTLAGKRIVLFGFAFKKNTEGTHNSGELVGFVTNCFHVYRYPRVARHRRCARPAR